MEGAAPGWYPVGDGGARRYWNGQAWTDHVDVPPSPTHPAAGRSAADLTEAFLRRALRPAGLTVAGLTFLVAATALVLEVLGAGRGWVAACLAFVSAFVTATAAWFERASRGGEERDPGRLIVVLPVIWALLLVFVVLPVSGGS